MALWCYYQYVNKKFLCKAESKKKSSNISVYILDVYYFAHTLIALKQLSYTTRSYASYRNILFTCSCNLKIRLFLFLQMYSLLSDTSWIRSPSYKQMTTEKAMSLISKKCNKPHAAGHCMCSANYSSG